MPIVYAKNLRLTPRPGRTGAAGFNAAVRSWIGARWPEGAQWFPLDQVGSLKGPDGSIFRWEPFLERDREIVDFTWRHADRDDPSISWVTTATYFNIDGKPRLSLRVSNTWENSSSVPFKPTTRPRLVLELLSQFEVDGPEGRLDTRPKVVSEGDVPAFVRYDLFDRDRTYPILVLTVGHDGNPVLDPTSLGADFLSLAKTVFLPTRGAAIVLTREIADKTLSVFNGAARLYQPGFSKAADPFRHPLFSPSRLVDQERRYVAAATLALETQKQFKEHAAIPLLRDERAVDIAQRRDALLEGLRTATDSDLNTWKGLANAYAQENDALQAAVKDAHAQVRELTDRLRFFEEKVGALEYALRARRGTSAEEEERTALGADAATVGEAAENAQLLFEEDLRILPAAMESAAASPFVRPRRAFELLAALAEVSRRMKEGPLGRPIKEVFTERGIDYRQGISDNASKRIAAQHTFVWEGVEYFCDERLCEGSSYDERFTLRIYFTSRSDDGITVGHIGCHLDTDSTT